MIPRWILPVLLCLLILSPAVSADSRTLTAPGVSSYSMTADQGYVIYQITVDDLPIGTNQTHTLTAGDATYLLEIGTYDEWGWKNADVTLHLPNGSVQTDHVSTLGLVITGYKTTIQYVYPQAYSGSFISTVHLTMGLIPLSASFNAGAMGWNPSTSLAFTAVSGNLGGLTTVYIEEMTTKDFQKNVVNYNPIYGLTNLGSQVFQWTWDAVLGFIGMIPVIGPAMVSMINTMGGIISTGYFWLNFVVSNFPAILCGVESLILMMAVINAGKGKNSFGKLARNVYEYNVAFALGCIGLASVVWTWTRTAVQMVAAVVNALKPI